MPLLVSAVLLKTQTLACLTRAMARVIFLLAGRVCLRQLVMIITRLLSMLIQV